MALTQEKIDQMRVVSKGVGSKLLGSVPKSEKEKKQDQAVQDYTASKRGFSPRVAEAKAGRVEEMKKQFSTYSSDPTKRRSFAGLGKAVATGVGIAGQGAGFAADVIGNVGIEAGRALLSEKQEQKIGGVATQVGQSEYVQGLVKRFKEYEASHPYESAALKGVGNFLGLYGGEALAAPVVKTLGSVAGTGLRGTATISRGAVRGIKQGAVSAVPALGTAARGSAEIAGGIGRGLVRGTKKASEIVTDKARIAKLPVVIKEAVRASVPEEFATKIFQATKDTKDIMRKMVDSASKKLRPLNVTGDYVSKVVSDLSKSMKQTGKELGELRKGLRGKDIDTQPILRAVADDLDQISLEVKDGRVVPQEGVSFDPDALEVLNDVYKYSSSATSAEMIDLLRQSLRRNFNKAGVPLTDNATRIATKYRDMMLDQIEVVSPKFGGVARQYATKIDALKDFAKWVGETSDLENISALKIGEKTRRLLGNASARPTEVFEKIFKVAQESGIKVRSDFNELIKFSDDLETLLGLTPATGFEGGIKRGFLSALRGGQGTVSAAIGALGELGEAGFKERVGALLKLLIDETVYKSGDSIPKTPKKLFLKAKNTVTTPTASGIPKKKGSSDNTLIQQAVAKGMSKEEFIKRQVMKESKKYKTVESFIINAKIFPESKVLPVVFHGTSADFTELKTGMKGYRTMLLQSKETISNGLFFTSSKETAKNFGDKVVEAKINLQNPLNSLADTRSGDITNPMELSNALDSLVKVNSEGKEYIDLGVDRFSIERFFDGEIVDLERFLTQDEGLDWRLFDESSFVESLAKQGFDGAIVSEGKDNGLSSYFVLSPEQVKTKSQLTDIYNQATKGGISNSLKTNPKTPKKLFLKMRSSTSGWSELQKTNPDLFNTGILRRSQVPFKAKGVIPEEVHSAQGKWQNYGQDYEVSADVIYKRIESGSFKGEYVDSAGNPVRDKTGNILQDTYDEATGEWIKPMVSNEQLKNNLLEKFSTKEGKKYLAEVISALPKNSNGTITAYRIGKIGEGVQSYTLSEGMAKTFSNQGTTILPAGTPGLPKGGYKDFGVLPANIVKIDPRGIKAWSPYDAEILVESKYVKPKR